VKRPPRKPHVPSRPESGGSKDACGPGLERGWRSGGPPAAPSLLSAGDYFLPLSLSAMAWISLTIWLALSATAFALSRAS